MAELTGDEKRVLDLVSRKNNPSREQVSEILSRQGPAAAGLSKGPPTVTTAMVDGLLSAKLLRLDPKGKENKRQVLSLTPQGWQAQGKPLLISFLNLRRAMGAIGMALPFVLLLGNLALGAWLKLFMENRGVQSSISAYYHTGMRNVFVGAICAIAVFLISYRGYDTEDNIWTKVAGAAAVMAAFLPTTPVLPAAEGLDPTPLQQRVGMAHLASAGVLFGVLAVICFRSFPKPDLAKGPYQPGSRKEQRNTFYKMCGGMIALSLLLILVVSLLPEDSAVMQIKPIFFLEFTALFFFGLSWLAKGGWIIKALRD